MQHGVNHKIQPLGKLKHKKSQGIEIKKDKNKKGDGRDLLKEVISTNKSFDYFVKTDYTRVHNLPPFNLPTKDDPLG